MINLTNYITEYEQEIQSNIPLVFYDKEDFTLDHPLEQWENFERFIQNKINNRELSNNHFLRYKELLDSIQSECPHLPYNHLLESLKISNVELTPFFFKEFDNQTLNRNTFKSQYPTEYEIFEQDIIKKINDQIESNPNAYEKTSWGWTIEKSNNTLTKEINYHLISDQRALLLNNQIQFNVFETPDSFEVYEIPPNYETLTNPYEKVTKKANEILDKIKKIRENIIAIVTKETRAGTTTTFIKETLKRTLRVLLLSITNKINTNVFSKATKGYYSVVLDSNTKMCSKIERIIRELCKYEPNRKNLSINTELFFVLKDQCCYKANHTKQYCAFYNKIKVGWVDTDNPVLKATIDPPFCPFAHILRHLNQEKITLVIDDTPPTIENDNETIPKGKAKQIQITNADLDELLNENFFSKNVREYIRNYREQGKTEIPNITLKKFDAMALTYDKLIALIISSISTQEIGGNPISKEILDEIAFI